MAEIQSVLDQIYMYLLSLAMAMTRPLGLFIILPVFTRLGLPDFLRAVVVLTVALPLAGALADPIKEAELTAIRLTVLGFKEVFIGLIMGFLIAIPFWAMEIAGNIVDFQREAPDASLQDPNATTETSITGTLFVLFAIVYFVSVDGFNIVFGMIYESYTIWPVLELLPSLNPDLGQNILSLLDQVLRLGFVLAMPLIIPIFLSMFVLMVIARFAPQLNVFDLSMAARNIAFFSLISIYSIFLIDYFTNEMKTLRVVLDKMRLFLQ